MFKKILHANDGSEGAFRALAAAIELTVEHKRYNKIIATRSTPPGCPIPFPIQCLENPRL